MDQATSAVLTVSGILFGFLYTAFWWTLNRELQFDTEGRHFKFGTGLLLASMILLGVFGIIIPLRSIAMANPHLLWSYRGIVLALVGTYGYMLTDLGHYGVYQLPHYKTATERLFFFATLAIVVVLAIKWWVVG